MLRLCARFVVLPAVFALMLACTGGLSSSSSSSVSEASSSTSSSGGESSSSGEPCDFCGESPPPPDDFVEAGPTPDGPPPPDSPFVACVLADPDTDASDDAGTITGDAGGGGGVSSPCDSPPPGACNGQLSMVQWQPGYCDGQQCQFGATIESCPGGCFIQLDGGPRCNNNNP